MRCPGIPTIAAFLQKCFQCCQVTPGASEASDEQTTKDCQTDSSALYLLTGHLPVGIEEIHASRHWCCWCISKQLEGLDQATQDLQSAAECTSSWPALNQTGQQSPGHSQLSSAAVKLRPCYDGHVAQCTSASARGVTADMELSTIVHPQCMLHSVCAAIACQSATAPVDRWT